MKESPLEILNILHTHVYFFNSHSHLCLRSQKVPQKSSDIRTEQAGAAAGDISRVPIQGLQPSETQTQRQN